MAATQGVYNKLKTKIVIAEVALKTSRIEEPKDIFNVATTDSFAIKPETNQVTMRQSPKPSGLNKGAR